MVHGGPEPHVMTPLAHLGFWDKVDKAPYDHILAAEAQKLFVSKLPHGEQDYWDACRAYCDVLYGRYMDTSDKEIMLDKTPAYALILPFMMKVFPDAKYIVLTRHPLATFSSYANSFFDGNYETAHEFNPILHRYVPAIARFIRQGEVSKIHVRYEDLVQDPQGTMRAIYDYLEVPFEAETIDYGGGERKEGLGDPIGVAQHKRPTTASLHKWVEDFVGDDQKRKFMAGVVSNLDPDDLETIGYPLDDLWAPLEKAQGKKVKPKKVKMTRYRLQRKAIVRLRRAAQRNQRFRSLLKKVRLATDVLLRE